eukprot:TRINITY_DN7774_c0_g1_i1.p1 TRINITY_DN7774_c0_g1~~TRINITY_DN7774_c0_g1_i1.p1  ORF type:complete len:162 (+),score=11.13 TRINITY_DN7774_c0_g1_i1:32-517(+)
MKVSWRVCMANLRKLGRGTKHRRSMLRTLVSHVIRHGRIKTTVTRAKEIRKIVDKMVTLAKKNTPSSRLMAFKYLFGRKHPITGEPSTYNKLLHEVASRFQDRQGGYTRTIRLGNRKGDNAPMCLFGFVDVVPSRKVLDELALQNTTIEQPAQIPPAEENQ